MASRRTYLQMLGVASIGSGVAGCLRLTEEDGDAEGTGAGSSDNNSGTRTDPISEIELTQVWDTEPGRGAIELDDGFVYTDIGQIRGVTPDGTETFSFDGFPEDHSIRLQSGWRLSAIGNETGVYFGTIPTEDDSEGARVYALDPETGDERWQRTEPADGLHDRINGVTVIDDLLIYVSQSGGSGNEQEPIIRAVDINTGNEEWRIEQSGEFVVGILVVNESLIVQETFRLVEYDLSDPDGEPTELPASLSGFYYMIQQGADGYATGDMLYGVDLANGTIDWQAQLDVEPTGFGPGISGQTIAVGSEAGFVFGFDRETGDQLWEDRVEGTIDDRIIAAEGAIWTTDERGTVYAFDPQTGERVLARPDTTDGNSSGFMINNGILFSASRGVGYEIDIS